VCSVGVCVCVCVCTCVVWASVCVCAWACVSGGVCSGVPRNFVGGSINSIEDRGQRERGSGGGSPLVRGSGGSCKLVQEISFHIVKLS